MTAPVQIMKPENQAVLTPASFDVTAVRKDFPILDQQVNGYPLVYLDNAATTQKPDVVIDAISHFYRHDNANVHRGLHALSGRATEQFEGAREKVRAFINAQSTSEIIFVRGATEAINLVAQSYGAENFKAGDEIIISEMEHHSNIVPWQIIAQQQGCEIKVIPINDEGDLDLEVFASLINARTKMVAVVHMSNALGTINPIKEMINIAHQHDIPVLVDGAQASAHGGVDVQALDADFYTLSAHKMYGPTGIGALYGKQHLLEKMPPYQSGGDMIAMVSFDKTEYNELPYKFEAGTPNIADVIGFGAAIDYLNGIGLELIAGHESELLAYATAKAQAFDGLTIIGNAKNKASILSFVLASAHPHDIGTIVDQQGIAIRAGHHCAMPVMQRYQLAATARASFALYNTCDEIDVLFAALEKVEEIFG